MIPKIIHYCWLSNDPQPELIKQCIASWRKNLPDFQIKLWNMDSLDFNTVAFTREALSDRRWTYMSDYVRLYALYHEGGIYLDSDVWVSGSIDALLKNDFFTGLEMRDKEHTQIYLEGAIMGACPGHPFIQKCLEFYNQRHFILEDGSRDMTPIPTIVSDIMEREYGWKREDKTQYLSDGIVVYSTHTIANTNCKRTRSVKLYHLNNRSWLPQTFRQRIIRTLKRIYRLLHF